MGRNFLKIFFAGLTLMTANASAAVFESDTTDYNNEEHRRNFLSEQSEKQYSKDKFNEYDEEKNLIFRQLEVITGDEETRYIIVAGDTLTITYIDRGEKVSSVYQVSDAGEIHMSLIGAVKVSGLNKRDLRGRLEELLSAYFRTPEVFISINTSGRYMIAGSVKIPGVYNIQPNLTVMEAILKAGSYEKKEAKLKSVLVMRGGIDGKPIVQKLNLHNLITKGIRKDNILVKPGDFIYVPRSIIADLKDFKDTVYDYVQTYFSYGRLPGPGDEGSDIFIYGN